jgi:hypothetical protein
VAAVARRPEPSPRVPLHRACLPSGGAWGRRAPVSRRARLSARASGPGVRRGWVVMGTRDASRRARSGGGSPAERCHRIDDAGVGRWGLADERAERGPVDGCGCTAAGGRRWPLARGGPMGWMSWRRGRRWARGLRSPSTPSGRNQES